MVMVSEKQLMANRENAKKGSVKTEAGKDVVRLNARKHGWLCRDLLLPDEDSELLWEIMESFMIDLKPEGAVEEMLVQFVVSGLWRLMRGRSMETAYIENRLNYCHRTSNNPEDTAPGDLVKLAMGNNSPWLNLSGRYEATIMNQIYKALHELERRQSA